MAAIEPAEDPRPTKNRRRFLYFLPAIPLMAAAAASLWSPFSRRNTRGSFKTPGTAPAALPSLHEASVRGEELMKSYPQPQWLPKDFGMWTALACSPEPLSRRGVFLGIDDSAQLRIAARPRSGRGHEGQINSSLFIHVAPATRMPALRGEEKWKRESVTLRTTEDDTVAARYYDDPRGNPEAFGAAHAVLLQRDGFAILVASFYKNRLTRAQLERVAVSIRRS